MSAAERYVLLLTARTSREVEAVREVLDDAGIPHRFGLLIGRPPSVVFTVPEARLDEAKETLARHAAEDASDPLPEPAGRFPWRHVGVVALVVLTHFMLVAVMTLAGEAARYEWLRHGALVRGATLLQPWRLVTSLVLHGGAGHAFWNGVSMMVFAVPLLSDLSYRWTGLIYLAAGIGGGVVGLAFVEPGRMIIGSSGAVAGLFGAWVVLTLRRARLASLPSRARIRALGIAMLVLPSLLSPVTSTGNPVSVGSHMGGLATGMLIGALISRGLLGPATPVTEALDFA